MDFVDVIKSNQELLSTIGSLSSLGFLVTSIIALIKWISSERRRRKLDEERAYLEVNNRYLDYLAIALQHPHLDVADYSLGQHQRILTPEEKVQQKILFSMLTSILERTFIVMHSWLGERHAEWAGWDSWIDTWFSKQNYREFWENPTMPGVFEPSGQYTPQFEEYMKKKYNARTYQRAGKA